MLILLEGPELAGKTTLAQRLNSECGFDVIHRGPPEQHVLLEYERTLEMWAAKDVVLDRWHIGETIYGPLLRGKSRLDPAMERHVDLFLRARGAYVVILVPGIETLDERWKVSTKDELIDWTTNLKVRSLYAEYANVHYGTVDRFSYVQYAETLTHKARVLERRTGFLRDYAAYVGPPSPDWLFVGDRPAKTHRNGHLAALVPYEGSSGHFLLTSLLAHDDECGLYGITNANVHQDTHSLWEELGRPNTVALGHSASGQLRTMNVPHATAPHPQFVRRFHHAEYERYGAALVHAADTGEDVGYCLP